VSWACRDRSTSNPPSSAEPGIAGDRANYRAAAGADGRAAKRALLSWCHVGAGDHRQSESGEYQIRFHDSPE
jgi:hypothetical protein